MLDLLCQNLCLSSLYLQELSLKCFSGAQYPPLDHTGDEISQDEFLSEEDPCGVHYEIDLCTNPDPRQSQIQRP